MKNYIYEVMHEEYDSEFSVKNIEGIVHKNDILKRAIKEIEARVNTSPYLHRHLINDDIYDTLKKIKDSKPIENIIDLEYDKDSNTEVILGYKLIEDNNFILITHEDFIYAELRLFFLDCSKDIKLIYTRETFDQFFEKHLKQLKIVRTEPTYPDGIYTIKNDMFGMGLAPMDVNDIEEPILRDNLNHKLHGEIINFMNNSDLYKQYNLEYKRGILLYGKPGNGKTSFLKSFFNNYPAIVINCNINDFEEVMYIKEFIGNPKYEERLKVIIFEDIDGMQSNMRSSVLNLLDGMSKVSKTLFIATTNYPNKLDSAITKRPSRFDSLYEIASPDEKTRMEIFLRFDKTISSEELSEGAKASHGMSGAYLKEIFLYSRINHITLGDAVKEINAKLRTIENYKE